MASKMARQASFTQEDPPADECRENVPPGVPETSNLKVQTDNEISSPVKLFEANGPGSNICTLSTPTVMSGGRGGKARPQLSGLRSAVTPVLKSLTIDNKCQNPLTHGNSPHLSSPFYHMGVSTANRESKGDPWRQIWAKDGSVSLIHEECLPEISSLDLTYLQLTANDSVLPQGSTTTSNDEIHQVQANVGESGGSPEVPWMTITTESTDLRSKGAPALAGILETEITLLDDSYNELSPVGQISSLDIIRDIPTCHYLNDSNALPEPSRQIASEPGSSNIFLNEGVSRTSMQSPKCATERTIGTSLEVTPDISVGSTLENGGFSSETSGQKMETSQTSDEDKVVPQPANITHDISTSTGNTSSKEIPSDVHLHSEPKETSNLVETKTGENQTSCDTESTSKMSQQSPEPTASGNNTFTVSSDSSTSASCSGNKTLDLPTVNKPKSECGTKSQAESATKTSFVVNQSSFSEKESSCGEQQLTFDVYSLQKSSGGSTLEAAAFSFKNHTFDCKAPSQKNGTITLSEISSTDGHYTLDKPSSPKVCNLTTSLKHDDSEEKSKELPKHEATTTPEMDEKPSVKLEATPALEGVSGDDGGETRHPSLSDLPVRDSSSDTSNNQCVDAVENKATSFNLDETLDLGTDFFITSTPMTNCKNFNFGSNREAGSASASQKKLYEDGPSKPSDTVVSDIPPNIVGDRKTFQKQPTVGSLRPPSKVAPQQSMSWWGSTIPGRLEKASAGLPLKRSRVQAAAGKPSTEEPRGTTGTSGSYSLRSLTAASRKPPLDLQRPQQRTISSGMIPRLTTGIRLPSTRTHMFSSSGPAVTNPVAKQPQGKKHPFPKGEALPVSKKKKTDTLTTSINAEASASSGDSTSKGKALRRPAVGQTSAPTKVQRNDAEGPTAGTSETSTSCDRPGKFRTLKPPGANQRAPLTNPQSHGCAKCVILQEELKLKSEEVQRLNEELLKYRKQDG